MHANKRKLLRLPEAVILVVLFTLSVYGIVRQSDMPSSTVDFQTPPFANESVPLTYVLYDEVDELVDDPSGYAVRADASVGPNALEAVHATVLAQVEVR